MGSNTPEFVFFYYIGLGSNVGNSFKTFKQAVKKIEVLGEIGAKSSLYRSQPYGLKEQENFLNAIIFLRTNTDPQELLVHLKQIETLLGRKPRRRWGPREIDLDILDYNGPLIKTDELKIPHIELEKRMFVLKPLMEIAPNFKNRAGIPIDLIINTCKDDGMVNRLEQDW